jgi:hypothetical protein
MGCVCGSVLSILKSAVVMVQENPLDCRRHAVVRPITPDPKIDTCIEGLKGNFESKEILFENRNFLRFGENLPQIHHDQKSNPLACSPTTAHYT